MNLRKMRLTEFCELSIAQIEVYIAGRGGIDLLNLSLSANNVSSLMKDDTPEIMKFLGLTGGRIIKGKLFKKANRYGAVFFRVFRHLGSKYYQLNILFSTTFIFFHYSLDLLFNKEGEIIEVTSRGTNILASSLPLPNLDQRRELDKGKILADFIKAPGIYAQTKSE